LNSDSSRTAGLEKYIKIKLNCKVMIIRNIDVSLGLVNGTIGTVKQVINDGFSGIPIKIKITVKKREFEIDRVKGKFEVFPGAFIYKNQFPIILVYGITIHKSQGMSLECCIADIGNNIFSCGQTYVALSRVTSLNGLHLINFDAANIKAQTSGIDEYNRLKQKYRPDLKLIDKNSQMHYKIRDLPGLNRPNITSSSANVVLKCNKSF